MAHDNLMKAHGQAVINLRKYAKQKIRSDMLRLVALRYPSNKVPMIWQAKKVWDLKMPWINWTWNVASFSDPGIFLRVSERGAGEVCRLSSGDYRRRHAADSSATWWDRIFTSIYMIRCAKQWRTRRE